MFPSHFNIGDIFLIFLLNFPRPQTKTNNFGHVLAMWSEYKIVHNVQQKTEIFPLFRRTYKMVLHALTDFLEYIFSVAAQ